MAGKVEFAKRVEVYSSVYSGRLLYGVHGVGGGRFAALRASNTYSPLSVMFFDFDGPVGDTHVSASFGAGVGGQAYGLAGGRLLVNNAPESGTGPNGPVDYWGSFYVSDASGVGSSVHRIVMPSSGAYWYDYPMADGGDGFIYAVGTSDTQLAGGGYGVRVLKFNASSGIYAGEFYPPGSSPASLSSRNYLKAGVSGRNIWVNFGGNKDQGRRFIIVPIDGGAVSSFVLPSNLQSQQIYGIIPREDGGVRIWGGDTSSGAFEAVVSPNGPQWLVSDSTVMTGSSYLYVAPPFAAYYGGVVTEDAPFICPVMDILWDGQGYLPRLNLAGPGLERQTDPALLPPIDGPGSVRGIVPWSEGYVVLSEASGGEGFADFFRVAYEEPADRWPADDLRAGMRDGRGYFS